MSHAERLTLAIECSNPTHACSVAVGSGWPPAPIGAEPLQPGRSPADDLSAAIARLLDRVGGGPGDLGWIAVSVGPGGYTSTRTAVVTAKLLAETASRATGEPIRCLPTPTARALLMRVPLDHREAGAVAVGLAWKRRDVWVHRFGAGDRVGAAGLCKLDHLPLEPGDTLVAEAALAEALDTEGLACVLPPMFDAVAVLEAASLDEAVDPVDLTPLYPREPEAVTKWRQRGQSRGAP